MDTLEAIITRRSVRKYTDVRINEVDINDMLKAGMHAPSANNRQPWHFIVIEDRKVLDEIPKIHPYAQMLKEAPLAILVCADKNAQEMEGYFSQDCSAAVQNILLVAHERGLGAVWLGIYPRQERIDPVKELMGTPEHIVPFALISVGYPAGELVKVDRFDISRVHRNRWEK